MGKSIALNLTKTRVLSFIWQHVLLIISLFIMTMGVAMCVRSALGCSVISTIPYVMTLAGGESKAPALTIGEYTYIMNAVFVLIQFIALRRRFEPVQLFQLVIGFFFGALLDLSMALTSWIGSESAVVQGIWQLAGCTVMGFGIALEIRCKSVTMPGEGITVAFSRLTGMPFAKMKIIIDSTLVCLAVLLGYLFFGAWPLKAVGAGTVFAMVYVGLVVKWVGARLGWFDRVLDYVPGFRRHIYGLLRFIKN